MKRQFLLCLAIAALGLGAAAADVPAPAHKILAPSFPSAAQATANAGPKSSAKKRHSTSSKKLLNARGVILAIKAANPAKGRPERLILAFGKRTIEVSMDAATTLKNAMGVAEAPSALKKGERIELSYRKIGKRELAVLISILS